MAGVLAVVLLVAASGAAAGAAAQDPVARGDQLLRAGRVFAAESVYYWATTSHPRDPRARLALDRHLMARGALRSAATLMEEARFFGGDAAAIARELAPLYERLGEYRALASLPASPLTAAEQSRAIWLRDNRPTHRLPSAVVVPLAPSAAGGTGKGIGAVLLRIGGSARDTVTAEIDPEVEGIVLDTAWQRHRGLRRFGATEPGAGGRVPAVAPVLALGGLSLGNVPVELAPLSGARARVGLAWLTRFTPAFDEDAGTLTLHPPARGTVSPAAGRTFPLYAPPGRTLVVHGNRLVPIDSPEGRLLRGARWRITRTELSILE